MKSGRVSFGIGMRWMLMAGLWGMGSLFAADPGQSRGMKPLVVIDERGETLAKFTGHYALVIGNSAYTGGWAPLKGVEKDVEAVKATLEKQGFAVEVATNLTSVRIDETVRTFVSTHGQDEGNRLVIWYAGHGQTRGRVGYLVGVDAPKPSERDFLLKAYPISRMKEAAAEMTSRHALFLFDSCFAGSIFASMRGAGDYVLAAAREPVRQFITAGSADEQVPDESFFRQEFCKAIDEGSADANRDGYVTGTELGGYLRQRVADRAGAAGIKLTPQSGVSEQDGFNKGDFVFQVGGAAAATAPKAPVRPANLDLSDLKGGEDAANRAAWKEWEDTLASSLAQVRTLAGDQAADPAAKRTAWRRLLEAFPDDDPYSKADDQARDEARAALAALAKIAPAKGKGAAAPSGKPAWAADFGKDDKGMWADLAVAGSTQRLRWLAPGTFTMGSPAGETGRLDDEVQHQVQLTSGLWMADSECPVGFWKAVTGAAPSGQADATLPVVEVNREDVDAFLAKLNQQAKGLIARLPTEAEWEYACRAGASGPHAAAIDGIAWHQGNGQGRIRTVKSKEPNAWGLFDLHGNVWEWCADRYGPYPGDGVDPSGPASGTSFIARGGCVNSPAIYVRSAYRFRFPPNRRTPMLGFRWVVPLY